LLQDEQWARPVILAQAARSRLRETCREQNPARARALAQAEGLSFERGAISLRRETLASASSRGSSRFFAAVVA